MRDATNGWSEMSMMRLWSAARRSAAVLVLVLATGCAGTPAPASSAPSESLLSAAGFKTLAATTAEQRQHLQWLHPGQVTAVQLTGKHYYVYPDVAKNQLYVGTPKEYEAYLALRTKSGLPAPAPAASEASDMQRYGKQDAAMAKANAQAATIPSWAIWGEFGNLGWVP